MTPMRAAQRPQMSSEHTCVSSTGPICGVLGVLWVVELVTCRPES